jgi:hypothetical protein
LRDHEICRRRKGAIGESVVRIPEREIGDVPVGRLTDLLILSANDTLRFGPGIAIRRPGGLSSHFHDLIAIVGLRGGSGAAAGFRFGGADECCGSSDDFTFIVGDRRHRCRSSVAQFLSPPVSELHWTDATISELRLEVEDREDFFGAVSEAGRDGSVTVDSGRRLTFLAICTVLFVLD